MLGDEEKEVSAMAGKFITNFAHVLDDDLSMFQISREVYSQHIPFRGKAQVVLVLLEAGFSRSPDLCARFRELVKEGCKVIGVPMPGFNITDFQKWWPDEMEEFENFSLFFDCRAGPEGDQWNGARIDKIRKELMPQVQHYLEEWTESDLTPTENGSDSISATPAPGPLEAQVCVSKEHLRKSVLVCPHCVQLGKPNPGSFKRDACMLAFLSHTVEESTFYCTVCQVKVKVNDILKRCIFLSYNWGCNNSTQKMAAPLCERILLETEMTYWLDVKGGMSFGDELVTEMREGVAGCVIVLLLISDAFCNSANCIREFVHTANLRKHVIPVLVPDKGPIRKGGPSSGWTGAYASGDTDWWKHAERICTSKDPDAPDKAIPWSYLASFTPIDLRQESLQADGSLQDDSPTAHEVIERIMKRFFRQ